jgi:hypothetical protein
MAPRRGMGGKAVPPCAGSQGVRGDGQSPVRGGPGGTGGRAVPPWAGGYTGGRAVPPWAGGYTGGRPPGLTLPQTAAANAVSANSTNVMTCTPVQYRQMLPMMNSSA